ncbi:hypothetical protein [uncultured Flavobacterium sp.]|uniref:hypothetical protein n=1 Tax=uncultured Flavobacterium sp. TaxID=165435 RepID=UPI0030CA1A24
MATNKKLTKIQDENNSTADSNYSFVASKENEGKAFQFRLFAFLAWIVAIGLQIFAIFKLLNPLNMTWIIVVIVVILVLSLTASWLWKKANRLDPASEKNKFKFFVQNQLGAIMGVLAFLPLLILILTNKNLTGKQKGIVGGIAGLALVIAGIGGADFNPPSVEQYTNQTRQVEDLTGANNVFWTKSGKSYHLFSDCGYINGKRTDEIFEGSVAKAHELKNITDLCDRCENQAIKSKQQIVVPTTLDSIPN